MIISVLSSVERGDKGRILDFWNLPMHDSAWAPLLGSRDAQDRRIVFGCRSSEMNRITPVMKTRGTHQFENIC